MILKKLLKLYNKLVKIKQQAINHFVNSIVVQTTFFPDYYHLNDLIWQDGFLIDFLQKKVLDKWVRKFLIYSAYLFNERLLFEKVVRFYIDLVFWPGQKVSLFEFSNVASTLFITLFLIIVIFLLMGLFYIFTLYFS